MFVVVFVSRGVYSDPLFILCQPKSMAKSASPARGRAEGLIGSFRTGGGTCPDACINFQLSYKAIYISAFFYFSGSSRAATTKGMGTLGKDLPAGGEWLEEVRHTDRKEEV